MLGVLIVGDSEYLDLGSCAELVGVSVRELRKAVRAGEFPEPAGHDGGSYWRDREVWKWAAAQGPPLTSKVPLRYWPTTSEPATYLRAGRLPHRYCRDDVVLTWSAKAGTVAVIWRPDDPIMLNLSDFRRSVQADVLVNVDPDFGVDGPAVRALNRERPDEQYDVNWRDLARVLGQPMPYWPYPLRDPALIEKWTPGTPTVEAPARVDLDTAPLLRMAAMFDRDHAAHYTLLDLVTTVQGRATHSALDDLRTLAEGAERHPSDHGPTGVVAAKPLAVLDYHQLPQIDPTTQRIGWLDLLGRSDTLSWQCIEQIAAWDGGENFPFCGIQNVDPDTAHGREWVNRLEPLDQPTAAFAMFADGRIRDPQCDPLTGAPAYRHHDGQIRTLAVQRIPATNELAEVILSGPIWIRTVDGTLYLAPRSVSHGLSWGYGGSGPHRLAQTVYQLLDDITADPAPIHGLPSEGLRDLAVMNWPAGTVLSRELLEAARDGKPWHHPNTPV